MYKGLTFNFCPRLVEDGRILLYYLQPFSIVLINGIPTICNIDSVTVRN